MAKRCGWSLHHTTVSKQGDCPCATTTTGCAQIDEVADAWREILEVMSMPVSEPDTPHTSPPDFMPRKEMSSRACDIKFLNFNTWKQHQSVVHDMSIKDWTLVYEQRDALKRNRALKRYALCLSRNPPIRPPIFKKLFGSKRSSTDIIFVNHIDGSNTSYGGQRTFGMDA